MWLKGGGASGTNRGFSRDWLREKGSMVDKGGTAAGSGGFA